MSVADFRELVGEFGGTPPSADDLRDPAQAQRLIEPLAWAAGRLIDRYYDGKLPIEVWRKEDGTLVTSLDVAIAAGTAEYIGEHYGGEVGVLGEEEAGKLNPHLPLRVVSDSVDGTTELVQGRPGASTIFGVQDGDEMLAVVRHDPLDPRFGGGVLTAHAGGGTFWNGDRITQSDPLSNTPIVVLDPKVWQSIPFLADMLRDGGLEPRGDASTGGKLTAVTLSRADATLRDIAEPYDVLPMLLAVKEAGGSVMNLAGDDQVFNRNPMTGQTTAEKGYIAGHPDVVDRLLGLVKVYQNDAIQQEVAAIRRHGNSLLAHAAELVPVKQ